MRTKSSPDCRRHISRARPPPLSALHGDAGARRQGQGPGGHQEVDGARLVAGLPGAGDVVHHRGEDDCAHKSHRRLFGPAPSAHRPVAQGQD
eukprot:2573392-Prymnesium_polylepis.1